MIGELQDVTANFTRPWIPGVSQAMTKDIKMTAGIPISEAETHLLKTPKH
jgi:hypothetical protein